MSSTSTEVTADMEPTATATAVVFDLFGVIAQTQTPEAQAVIFSVADRGGEAGSGIQYDAFWTAYWQMREPYDGSQISAAAYWHAVAAELGISFSAQQILDLIDADCDSWRNVDPAMVHLIEDLTESGLTVGLLSNIPAELALTFEPRNPWLNLMASVGFSCRIGHAKPQQGAYEWSARSLGLAPQEILFIDDRAGNVQAAEAFGMAGHVFTGIDAATEMIAKVTGWSPSGPGQPVDGQASAHRC